MAQITSTDRDTALPAFPSLTAAAGMVGVSPSTLQRRDDIEAIRCGREHRLDPRTVLRLTAHYGNRSVMEAANDLVAYAVQRAEVHAERVEEIVDDFMRERHIKQAASRSAKKLSVEQVLDELASYLSEDNRAEVEQALRRAASQ